MFVLKWRYRVWTQHVEAFKSTYGPGGDWANLFATSDDFIRTELYQDPSDFNQFMTLDHWRDYEAFVAFQGSRGALYRELDAQCEHWTENEEFCGAFVLDPSLSKSALYC